MTIECRTARLAIGGEPQHLPPDVQAHVAGCVACTRFRDETLTMERRLRSALELPLHRFRQPGATPAPARRFALAASVVLALLVGGGFWLLRPQTALASELVEHMAHEPESWVQQRPLTRPELAAVLERGSDNDTAGGYSGLSMTTQRVDGGTIFPGSGGSRDPKAASMVVVKETILLASSTMLMWLVAGISGVWPRMSAIGWRSSCAMAMYMRGISGK